MKALTRVNLACKDNRKERNVDCAHDASYCRVPIDYSREFTSEANLGLDAVRIEWRAVLFVAIRTGARGVQPTNVTFARHAAYPAVSAIIRIGQTILRAMAAGLDTAGVVAAVPTRPEVQRGLGGG